MNVIVRSLFFLMFSSCFIFADDGFHLFASSYDDHSKKQQKNSKKRPFSEIEEPQEEFKYKNYLSIKTRLGEDLNQVYIRMQSVGPDSCKNIEQTLQGFIENRWLFDLIKELLWDVEYDHICCDILEFIGKNSNFHMTYRLEALEILDTARQPFLNHLSPHEKTLQGCFLISANVDDWARFQRESSGGISNVRVTQYINDFVYKHPSLHPEDFIKCLIAIANDPDMSLVYRKRAFNMLRWTEKKDYFLPTCLSFAKDTSISIPDRRVAALLLIRENIKTPEAIEVCQAMLGSDYYDEIMRVRSKYEVIENLLSKLPVDKEKTLRAYLDKKRIKLEIENSALLNVMGGVYRFHTLRSKRMSKEENFKNFVHEETLPPLNHPFFLSLEEKEENYGALIHYFEQNPDDQGAMMLGVAQKKQLIGKFKTALLDAVLSKINFYLLHLDVLLLSRNEIISSLAVVDIDFDLSLWPHPHCIHVAKTKTAKKQKDGSSHGTEVLQTAFSLFNEWEEGKSKAHVLTMEGEGFVYKGDTKALNRRLLPTTTFNMSYGENEHIKGKELSRITENVNFLLKDSDRLLVFAAGNDKEEMNENKDRSLVYLKQEDILEHVIIAGSWDVITNVFAAYSNHAGAYKDHFIIAPGNAISALGGTHQGAHYFPLYGRGTSFAAPVISASISILRSLFPQANYKDVKEAVLSTAQKNFPEYKPEIHGQGILDVYQAYLFLDNKFQPSLV